MTCGSLWDEAKEKVNRSYSLLEKEIGKESYSGDNSVEQFKKVPSVLKDVFSEAHRHLSTEIGLPAKSYDNKNVTFDNVTYNQNTKERFKLIINDENGSEGQTTELKTTESGNLALEFDEKIISLIEEKCAENPDVFVSLHETDSENYVINFSPIENTSNRDQKISIKKTPSGTRLLEVHKDFMNRLIRNEARNNMINNYEDSHTKQSKNTSEAMCDCKHHAENIVNDSKISNISSTSKQKGNLQELQRLWEEGVRVISIKVKGRNEQCKEIKGTLNRNSLGEIVVDITNISSLGEVTFKTGECHALFTQMPSDTFLLEICHDESNFNVILRRSTGGGIILVTTDSDLKTTTDSYQRAYETRPKNDFFRVTVKSTNKPLKEPPAVLKMTPSRNYTFILDKEYEKTFKNAIDECIVDDSECFVELDKTNSGNFLVILDDEDMIDNCEHNALLMKSPSGHIKVMMHEPEFECLDNISQKKISNSSTRAFSQLLDKLPPSNRKINREESKRPVLTDIKSCSDSHLYDKVKTEYPRHTNLVEPSATLTKTPSGQYAVVLNKESKKAFVNNLRSYLSGSQGLIPIKRTESGEITISLNNDHEANNCGYGSLKITPSGNIYVTIDERVFEGMVKDSKYNEGVSLGDELSRHIIETIKRPVNKSVTTTCNAKPDSCTCDVSKCVCKELQLDPSNWFQCNALNHYVDSTTVRKEPCSGYKICNPKKCKEPCCAGSKSTESSANKSPHIVIKPCDCSQVLPKNPRSEECCYVVEAICPFHIDRYETVNNELLEITDLCKNAIEIKKPSLGNYIKTNDSAVRDRSWDSLNYLPPQLPRFLQDYNFR